MTESERAEPTTDFTRINGIGPKKAAALHEIGINTMRELAAAQVDELADALEDAEVSVSTAKILSQGWLQQAWRHATAESVGESSEEPEAPGDQLGPVAEEPTDEWEEHASFIVSFDRAPGPEEEQWQTRVWDTKGLVEVKIPGTATERWVEVVVDRADLPAS